MYFAMQAHKHRFCKQEMCFCGINVTMNVQQLNSIVLQ